MHTVIVILGNLGYVSLRESDLGSAKSFLTEAYALSRELNKRPQIAFCLLGFVAILAMQRKAERATQLLPVVQGFVVSGDARTINPADEAEYNHYLALTRAQLDEATFNAAWAEGQKMALEQAIDLALAEINASAP